MGTQKFRNILKETLEEQGRIGSFVRIFPAKGCDIYNTFFKTRRVSNQALYYALYVEMMIDEQGSIPPPLTQYEEPIDDSTPTTAAPPSVELSQRKCPTCNEAFENQENTC